MALQRPSKLPVGTTGLAPAIRLDAAGADDGADCCDPACGVALWGDAWATSVCDRGSNLVAGAGEAAAAGEMTATEADAGV